MLSKVANYVIHLHVPEQKWKSYYFDEKWKNHPYQNTHPEITTDLELLCKLSLKKINAAPFSQKNMAHLSHKYKVST